MSPFSLRGISDSEYRFAISWLFGFSAFLLPFTPQFGRAGVSAPVVQSSGSQILRSLLKLVGQILSFLHGARWLSLSCIGANGISLE